LLADKKYDLIIANINRNILLQDIGVYTKSLEQNGKLIISGFYTEYIPIIEKEAQINGLSMIWRLERNNWVGLKFEKL
jgi:ribosomal protein L11 methyltransferase